MGADLSFVTVMCDVAKKEDLDLEYKEASGSPRLGLQPHNSEEVRKSNKMAWINAVQEEDIFWMEDIAEDCPDTIVETVLPNGDRALHHAIRQRNKKLLFFVLSMGAHTNAPNALSGDTPLHLAVEAQDLNGTALLLKYGANPGLRNNAGDTATEMARRVDDPHILSILSPAAMFVIDFGLESGEHYDENTSTEYELGLFAPMCTVSEEKPLEDNLSLPPPISIPEDRASNHLKLTNQHSTPKPRPSIEAVHELVAHSDTITTDLFHTIDDIREEEKQVDATNVSGWLQKKRSKAPYSYQNRWVVLKGAYLLWADRKITLDNPSDPRQRNRFSYSISFIAIKSIEPVQSSSGKKFKIIVRGVRRKKGASGLRVYEFKAATETDRDFWVAKLEDHKRHYDQMLSILEAESR